MKKLFILLSLPLFFSLNSKSLAYTRAELIQDRLSKIGIKQDIIDETIKFQYDIKDEKNFFTEEGKESDDFQKLKEIYEKDERNETLGATIAGAYMVGEQKDFKKARQYMDKISKYSSKFDRLSNELSYYKLKGDEKNSKKYYNLLKRSYKGTPVMDLVEILNDNLDTTENKRQSVMQLIMPLPKYLSYILLKIQDSVKAVFLFCLKWGWKIGKINN